MIYRLLMLILLSSYFKVCSGTLVEIESLHKFALFEFLGRHLWVLPLEEL